MNPSRSKLLPTLGLFTTITVVVGGMIGSGIFKKPALMASQLGSAEWLIAVWVIAGLVTLCAALTNAEIAGLVSSRRDATGGQYLYFQMMYGNFFGWLYGWAMFAVVQTGSIAGIAYVFGAYWNYFQPLVHLSPRLEAITFHIPGIGNIFPLADFGTKAMTAFVIILLTAINYYGVRFGGLVQSISTVLKVCAIAAIILFGFLLANGSTANFTATLPVFHSTHGIAFVAILMTAMSGAFWAYDGWNSLTYISGEVKNPQRNIPRALIIGVGAVVVIYSLTTLAYLYVLPLNEMAASQLVATDVAQKFLGPMGAGFVAIAVLISTFGCTNSALMASPRVYYTMAHDKLFPKSFGTTHERFHTPSTALLIQCVWAVIMVFSGTFDTLTDMLIFVQWIFYATGAYGVFVMRKKMPDAERPYRVIGYPVIPLIVVLFSTVYLGFTLYTDITSYMRGEVPIINSVMGLVLCSIGLPIYFYYRKISPRTSA